MLDIDECALNNTCADSLACVNTLGNYICIAGSLNLEDVSLDWRGGEFITATLMLQPNTSFIGFDIAMEETYLVKSPVYGTAPGDREYSCQSVSYNYTEATGELLFSCATTQGNIE